MKHFLIIIGVLVLCRFQVAAQFVNQGTLYISSGTPVATNEALTNSGTFTNRGTLVLRSDLTNSAQFDASQGESVLAGNTLQTINSSNALSFQKLTIQNSTSGESIRLNSSVGVTGQLALTAGIIKTNPANPLLLGESAQVTGAGNSAHVVGYVSKTGNTAFVFPLGNGTTYRPAYISPQGLPTMTFSAAYVESSPTTTSRSACLQALSDKEYWVINGSGSVQVGLPYQNVATSPKITSSLPTLRVARLSSVWETLTCDGNGGIVQGFVLSNGLQPQLGQFTLAKQGLSTQILTQPASASTVCLGGSAAVAVAATGENLGYQWKKDGQLLVGQQSATLALSLINPADAGTYTVEVTGTYGAVMSTGFTLTVSQPVASLVSSGPITCSTTSVTLTAAGGNSYKLSDEQTSASGHFLVSTTGLYSVTATTPQGCTATAQTGVNSYVQAPSVSLSNNGPLTCSKSAVKLTANPYVPNCAAVTYAYSGPGLVDSNASYGTADVTTAGVYSVTLTDAYGCTATAQTTVNANQSAPTVNLVSNGALSCTSTNVLLTASGGSSYRFSTGAAQINGGNTASVNATGIYSVTVTTVDGCTATAQTTITSDTNVPVATLDNDGPLTCAKPTALLTAGGAGTYRFSAGTTQLDKESATASVSTAGVYSVTVTAPNGCFAVAQTTVAADQTTPIATLANSGPLTCTNALVTLTATGGKSYRFSTDATQLENDNTATVTAAGIYSVTVTAANGCTATAQTTVTGDQTAPMAELSNNGPLTCTNTAVTLTAAGKGSYRFSQGATQAEGGNTATISAAGVYSVTVTAANGCTATAQTTVKADQTTPSVVLSNSGPLRCNNPTVTLTASGNGTYRFSQGATQLENSNVATVSAAGVYSVTIITTNGCTATGQTTVTQDTDLPVATLGNDGPLTCAKPTVTLVAGGKGSYRFSAGATQPTEGSANATVSVAGVYSVTVTAANGCYAVAQTTVDADQILPTVSLINSGPLTCVNAQVTLTATGGKLYQFSAGAAQLAGGNTATVSTAGVYSVTVTAANGCTAVNTTTVIGDQVVPTAELINNGPLTCANTAVTLTATGKGSYRFSQGAAQIENGNTATVSASGVYSVTVTAANGCSATAQSTVKANTDLPVVSLISSGPLTCAKPTVTLTAGGTGTYHFSTGAVQINGGNTATVTTAGVYSVTVTNENGCAAVATTTVELNSEINPPALTASALVTERLPVQVTASGCAGTISWNVQGGTGVANGAIYTLTQPANYTLTARCTVGTCTSTDATPLVVSIRPGDFAIASVNTVSCLLVNASRGEYSVKFTPVYSGLTGAPVSFSVINEKLPTDAVAPYTLRLYSDNPTITLVAEQAGSGEARFAYSWRAVCSGNTGENRPPVATGIPTQQLIVNQPYQLDLTAYFADPDGQTLSFYAEGLPTGLSLTGGRISGTPSTTGVSQVTVTAIDPGSLQVSTVVSLNVNPAVVTPTPGTFAITGVTTVNCEVVSAGERRVTLMPQYSGLNGQPVAFSVKNEMTPTTLAGPHTVRLYTDNPVVTLLATQSGIAVSYQYSWLAACSTTTPTPTPTPNPTPTNVAPVVAIPLASQTATVGQGYSLYISRNTFSDANGDALTLSVGSLPAGLSYSSSLSAITGTPAQAGESLILVTATDGGGLSASTSFRLTIVAPTQPTPTPTPTPTPGTFAIASVNTVNCEVVSASERRVIFMPLYNGVDGQPISFAVKNEMVSTTAPGPYALRVYTDNPTLTLMATQSGATVSYQYNWLAGCGTTTPVNPNPTPNPMPTNVAPVVAVAMTDQSATVGQTYSLRIPVGTFTDANNDVLTISVSGLPAGLNFTAGSATISGTPTQAGQSIVTVTAMDAGGLLASTSFKLTIVAPTQPTPTPTPTPTPGTFAIASVNTVNCEVLAGAERRVRFTPVYSGVSGAPISFSIVNELSTTTAAGPYSLRVYTDNPAITLVAEQSGTVVNYRYEWLKGCTTNGRQGALEAVRPLQVTVFGNPVVGESAEVEIHGVERQPVQVQVVDLLGNAIYQQSILQAGATERLSLPLGRSQGLLLLRVSTPSQQQQIKLLRP